MTLLRFDTGEGSIPAPACKTGLRPLAMAALVVAAAQPSAAQSPGSCPPGTESCSIVNNQLGDTSTPSNAENTTTISSQSGVSSASNSSASDSNITGTVKQSPSLEATNSPTGSVESSITGGNTSASSGANTGSLTNANSTGPVTSTIGDLATGPSTATVGNTTTGPSSAAVGNTTTGPSTATIGNTSTGSNTNSMAGGSQSASTGASNSSTVVDASSHDSSRYVFVPPVVPPTPPSTVTVGNIVKETFACGPLQRVVREPVTGTYFGLIGRGRVAQGTTERLEPYLDASGRQVEYRKVMLEDGFGYRLFGHQVTQYTTVVGVSAARHIAIGGGGGNGAWGQGGGGASSAMQQMVTTIQLRECEIGSFVPPPRTVYVEPRAIRQ